MTRRLLVAVLLLILAAACGGEEEDAAAPAVTPQPASEPAAVETGPTAAPEPTEAVYGDRAATLTQLREGGLVVYVRHAATEPVTEDPATLDLDDPSTQRNLSEEGRAQAVAIGEAFRALDVPVGDVFSSPYHRALETARLAFPDAEVAVRDDLLFPEHPDADVPALVAAARRYLATPPAGDGNTVVVAHAGNLEGAAQLRIEEGAAAVFEPGASPRLLEVVPADGWTPEAP